MNFETIIAGVALLTMSIVGFRYMLKLQDKMIDRMKDRFDPDSVIT